MRIEREYDAFEDDYLIRKSKGEKAHKAEHIAPMKHRVLKEKTKLKPVVRKVTESLNKKSGFMHKYKQDEIKFFEWHRRGSTIKMA